MSNQFNEAQECVLVLRRKQQENKASRGGMSAGWSLMTTTSSSREGYRGQSLMGTKQCLTVTCLPINAVLYFMQGLLHLAVSSCKTKQISHTDIDTDMLCNRGFSQRILNIM